MASRKDEKEARKAERVAQEQSEAQKQAHKKRVALIGGIAVILAAIVVAAIIIIPSLGGDSSMKMGKHSDSTIEAVSIPAQQFTNLDVAAKKAGCTVNIYKNFGRQHTAKAVTFKTNPPTSGNHNPAPADDGAYGPANTPPVGKLVHALEHGRVIIQYSPGLPTKELGQLKSVFEENNAYHMILAENQTKMPYEVAVTTWTKSLTCKKFSPQVFDAIRDFRDKYVDKAPEFVP